MMDYRRGSDLAHFSEAEIEQHRTRKPQPVHPTPPDWLNQPSGS